MLINKSIFFYEKEKIHCIPHALKWKIVISDLRYNDIRNNNSKSIDK